MNREMLLRRRDMCNIIFLPSITLPEGKYIQIDYYPVPATSELSCKISLNKRPLGNAWLFGCRYDGSVSTSFCSLVDIYALNFRLRLDFLSIVYTNIRAEEIIDISYSSVPSPRVADVNGIKYTSDASKSTSRLPYKFIIHGHEDFYSQNTDTNYDLTIYANDGKGWQIGESGETLIQLMPARSNNEDGLYDIINKTWYPII